MTSHNVRNKRAALSAEHKRHLRSASIGVFAITSLLAVSATYANTLLQPQDVPPVVSVANTASTTPPGPNAYANVSLIGKAAIVYDLTTGQTLYAQNSNAQLPLASITKLLTLYAAANVLQPSSPITMSADSVAQTNDAADVGFKAGETFKFEDLARLTLAAS